MILFGYQTSPSVASNGIIFFLFFFGWLTSWLVRMNLFSLHLTDIYSSLFFSILLSKLNPTKKVLFYYIGLITTTKTLFVVCCCYVYVCVYLISYHSKSCFLVCCVYKNKHIECNENGNHVREAKTNKHLPTTNSG